MGMMQLPFGNLKHDATNRFWAWSMLFNFARFRSIYLIRSMTSAFAAVEVSFCVYFTFDFSHHIFVVTFSYFFFWDTLSRILSFVFTFFLWFTPPLSLSTHSFIYPHVCVPGVQPGGPPLLALLLKFAWSPSRVDNSRFNILLLELINQLLSWLMVKPVRHTNSFFSSSVG